MTAKELRGHGIGNATAILEMSGAAQDGNHELLKFWTKVYKTLLA